MCKYCKCVCLLLIPDSSVLQSRWNRGCYIIHYDMVNFDDHDDLSSHVARHDSPACNNDTRKGPRKHFRVCRTPGNPSIPSQIYTAFSWKVKVDDPAVRHFRSMHASHLSHREQKRRQQTLEKNIGQTLTQNVQDMTSKAPHSIYQRMQKGLVVIGQVTQTRHSRSSC